MNMNVMIYQRVKDNEGYNKLYHTNSTFHNAVIAMGDGTDPLAIIGELSIMIEHYQQMCTDAELKRPHQIILKGEEAVKAFNAWTNMQNDKGESVTGDS